MNSELYDMIFKRKSFHLFLDIGNNKISDEELKLIEKYFKKVKPLNKDIKVKMKLVPASSTTCKRKEEYCILFYSENKPDYLKNIGYMGEQLDLYLTSLNIGTLWFGIGKTEEKVDNLEYVIMIAIAKVDENKFRKDMYKSKRKFLNEVWQGDYYKEIGDIIRFAPSACNTQPWYVKTTDKSIEVYRYRKEGKRGIMPKNKVIFYNQIDIGIYLCFLEICLDKNNLKYDREVFEEKDPEAEYNLEARYSIK